MPAKPRKFPRLPYGGGSFRWDEQRSQCVLQFQVGGRTTTVRDATPAGCILKRELHNDPCIHIGGEGGGADYMKEVRLQVGVDFAWRVVVVAHPRILPD